MDWTVWDNVWPKIPVQAEVFNAAVTLFTYAYMTVKRLKSTVVATPDLHGKGRREAGLFKVCQECLGAAETGSGAVSLLIVSNV